MRRTSALFICLATGLIQSIAVAGDTNTAPFEVYFSPNGNGHKGVTKLIESAQKSVDIAMYSVSPGQVEMWKPLADAITQRNLKCRVILHNANDSAVKGKATAFENIKCDVRFISKTMHQKFAIVDDVHVTTGSANWSVGAEQKYSENISVYRSHQSIANSYKAEFARLWDRSADYPVTTPKVKYPKSPEGPGVAPAAADGVANYFTTLNSKTSTIINDALVQLIRNSKSTLDVAVANFNSELIREAVCDAHKRGVQVRVLMDQSQFSLSVSEAKNLEKCKVPVRYKVYGLIHLQKRAQLMHHKLLIADGRWLATGSYNWSTTAEKSNAENLQVIDGALPANAANLAAFKAEVDKLWDINRDKLAAITKAFAEEKEKCVPIHWDSKYFNMVLSVNRKEYSAIRKEPTKAVYELLKDANNWNNSCIDMKQKKLLPSAPSSGSFLP